MIIKTNGGQRQQSLRFAISSHSMYYKVSIPPLLKSLTESGVLPEDIIVVVGECESDSREQVNEIQYIFVSHNSFDHTALIEIIERGYIADYWWVMHDTFTVGLNFLKAISIVQEGFGYHCVCKDGWLNSGMFASWFLKEAKNYILSLKNCTKSRAIMSEKLYTRMTPTYYYESEEPYDLGISDFYGMNVERRTLHFKNCDLYKHQANFAGTKSLEKVINP